MLSSFTALGLSPELSQTLETLGYRSPTAIQLDAIPKILTGADIVAIAQTGTGKTAAYALPLIERLKHYANTSTSPAKHPVRLVILAPTRELAQQIEVNISLFLQTTNLKQVVLHGGTAIEPQLESLRRGVEIIIATVGRLNDLLQRQPSILNKVEMIVLDEADRMLDIGFLEDIRRIFLSLPVARQTLLFSATFSKQIEQLSGEFLKQPERIEIAPNNSTTDTIEQHFITIENNHKQNLLLSLVARLNGAQVLVFCNTKISVDQTSRFLSKHQLRVEGLHGDKSQNMREAILQEFKHGSIQILICTDIAARGLDIAGLPWVINYDLPRQAEDYVHRIGRTGRAGLKGIAISLVEESACKEYQQILVLTQQKLPLETVVFNQSCWRYQPASARPKPPTAIPLATPLAALPPSKVPRKSHLKTKKNLKQTITCALLLPNYGLPKRSNKEQKN
ncbi:MAG: DEAD/DEAH box helicase [Neisseriaceae bacterium]